MVVIEDHDVSGLDVPVDYSTFVDVRQGVCEVVTDLGCMARPERPIREAALEIRAFHEFHHEVDTRPSWFGLVDSGVQERHQAVVVQARQDLQLRLGIVRCIRASGPGDNLDGHFALEEFILGPVDVCHGSGPDPFQDVVPAAQDRAC